MKRLRSRTIRVTDHCGIVVPFLITSSLVLVVLFTALVLSVSGSATCSSAVSATVS